MRFEVVGRITDIEVIAAGPSVPMLPVLRKRYGKGRWRKVKGIANVRLPDGAVRLAELHWFEAHGIGGRRCELSVSWIDDMAKRNRSTTQFVICIKTDDPDLLTPRRVYQVLPDESAAKSNHIRVIDNEGEDYLYPADYFIFVDFPVAAERALLQAC